MTEFSARGQSAKGLHGGGELSLPFSSPFPWLRASAKGKTVDEENPIANGNDKGKKIKFFSKTLDPNYVGVKMSYLPFLFYMTW